MYRSVQGDFPVNSDGALSRTPALRTWPIIQRFAVAAKVVVVINGGGGGGGGGSGGGGDAAATAMLVGGRSVNVYDCDDDDQKKNTSSSCATVHVSMLENRRNQTHLDPFVPSIMP